MLLGINVADDVVPLTLRPEVEHDASPVLAFLHEHPAHFGLWMNVIFGVASTFSTSYVLLPYRV